MGEPEDKPQDGPADALRTAVERTLAATADSATETRQRAQSLLDDVVRRGQVARDQVTRRGEEASSRLAEAINDLRSADGETLEQLREQIVALDARLSALEGRLQAESNPPVKGEVYTAEPHDQRDSED